MSPLSSRGAGVVGAAGVGGGALVAGAAEVAGAAGVGGAALVAEEAGVAVGDIRSSGNICSALYYTLQQQIATP